MKAPFRNCILSDSFLTWDRARAVLAEMIDDEMLVPEVNEHYSEELSVDSVFNFDPKVSKSGFKIPLPSRRDHVVMPLLLNGATFSPVESKLPTPITLIKSPGLFSVPWNGPSLPIAETTITPLAVTSLILSIKG